MSPTTSTSASTAESPLLMPLPTFDQPLWDALGFPLTPLSSTLASTLPSPGFPIESTFPDLHAMSHSSDLIGVDAESNCLDCSSPEITQPKEDEEARCFCNSTTLIDSLRSTLRSSVGAEEGLRSASRASATCSRSRFCDVCAKDPSTPIAAFTVLSLVTQILAAAVDGVLSAVGGAKSMGEHADPSQPEREEATSTGMSETPRVDAMCTPIPAEPLATALPTSEGFRLNVVTVKIGNFTLPYRNSRGVLLVALQDSLRGLRDAGSEFRMGDMACGLEKQMAETETKISASLNEP